MKTFGNILIAASLPFFLETSFEMYLLTPLHGQQMLFFSVAHIAPLAFLLILGLSGLAFGCLALFALATLILNFAGVINTGKGYARAMLIILSVQAVHTILFLTYDLWAPAFG